MRTALAQVIEFASEQRNEEQKLRLGKHQPLLVTADTLSQFNAEEARLVADYRKAEICRNTDARKEMDDLQKVIDSIRAEIPREYFIRALTEPSAIDLLIQTRKSLKSGGRTDFAG